MNPLDHLNDSLWSSLQFVILNIPPSRLPIFPCLAGCVWFATLLGLLLSWIGHGMPRYPGQTYPIAWVSTPPLSKLEVVVKCQADEVIDSFRILRRLN